MKSEDLDVVFAQIKDIVMNKPIRQRLANPTEEEEKIQDALLYLSSCLNENNEFLSHLNQGSLNFPAPGRRNFLASGLKELHAIMQHIVWQAQQVAEGDYSQRMDYLGEFSNAFNTMTEQLREREQKLQEVAEDTTRSANLLEALLSASNDWIIITNKSETVILYSNRKMDQQFVYFVQNPHLYKVVRHENAEGQPEKTILFAEDTGRFYSTHHCEVDWKGSDAKVFFIRDITNQELGHQDLSNLAHKDELTGAYNRQYFNSYLSEMLKSRVKFSFVLVDLNSLNYANDTYGRESGDGYLTAVMEQMNLVSREADMVFRLEGDEFVILFKDCVQEQAEEKMEEVNHKLANLESEFPMSISYGIAYADGEEEETTEHLLDITDELMYLFKVKYKREHPLPNQEG
ncbi:MAG: diguanylate cyclase [Eubacteriales bacterium]